MGQKILLIAEKDSLGGQIAAAFGIKQKSSAGYFYENDQVIIAMASGHLYQLSPKEKIETLPYLPFSSGLQYMADPNKMNRVTTIKRLMQRQDISEVCNACDPGREGELIGSVIVEQIGLQGKKFTRLWASSQAPDAILDSFKKRKEASHYANLLAAAKLRAEGDLVFGINSSRAITNLNRKKTGTQSSFSAGRVQTPTLAMIVIREQEIASFSSHPFWQVYLHLFVDDHLNKLIWTTGKELGHSTASVDEDDQDEDDTEATNNSRILDKRQADSIRQKILNAVVTLNDVTQKASETFVEPPQMLDGTTLQSLANKELGFTLSKTMSLLQSLYDAGYVSYPRSESKFLAIDDKEQVIKSLKMLKEHRDFNDAAEKIILNVDQWVDISKRRNFVERDKLIDGHGAIIPTEQPISGQISIDEANLYNLIIKRFLMAFYPAAEYAVIETLIKVNGETFYGHGRTLINPGWTEIAPVKANKPDKEVSLMTPINGSSKLTIADVKVIESKTKPPHRFTEGKLVQAMKKHGLGTVATREPIVANLKGEKGALSKAPYLEIDGKYLKPTIDGYSLIDYLQSHELSLVCQPEFTSEFEEHLQDLTSGRSNIEQAREFLYNHTKAVVNTINSSLNATPNFRLELGTCPSCSKGQVVDTGDLKCSCEACDFHLYKRYSGTLLTTEQLQKLLTTPFELSTPLKFVSKATGKPFTAILALVQTDSVWKVEFRFPKQEYGLCPKCKSANVIRKNKSYIECENNCGFGTFSTVAKYALPDQQLKKLFTVGATDLIDKFQSNQGKNFACFLTLELNQDGKLGFKMNFSNKK